VIPEIEFQTSDICKLMEEKEEAVIAPLAMTLLEAEIVMVSEASSETVIVRPPTVLLEPEM
jgi:hypothetical protein